MFETHSGGLENVSKVSPVLSMLLSADGLTGVALEAARPLRLARDDQQPRITRLDALGLFIKRLPKVMPDQRVLLALTTEALDLFEPSLNGARLTELRIGLSAREFHLSWDMLHCADWDLDGQQMKDVDHQARTLLDFAFRLPIRRFWEQPVSELLCDTEEAAATIRLMRLYVHLNVLTLPEHQSSAGVLRQCARGMGLWRHAETALPRLPTRPRGPVGLYDPPPASLFDAEGPGPGRWRDAAPCPAEKKAAAVAELVRQSRALRQDMIHQLAGHADLWAGWQADVA